MNIAEAGILPGSRRRLRTDNAANPAEPYCVLIVVLQADFQLVDGCVNSLDRIRAMPAEIVLGLGKISPRRTQSINGLVNVMVPLGRSSGGWRGLGLGSRRSRRRYRR